MEQLYLQNKKLIEACADKLCRLFHCEGLREDFVSAGTLALLTYAEKYDPDSGAAISTFLYPYIVGAMKRELERSLYPICLTKREFEGLQVGGSLGFLSLDVNLNDSDEPVMQIIDHKVDVEWAVFQAIYLEVLRQEFEKLSFKERQILGGFFGVYGHRAQSIAELGEEFDLTENATAKAKDKALGKLSKACLEGEIGAWRLARKAIKQAQREANPSAARQACEEIKITAT